MAYSIWWSALIQELPKNPHRATSSEQKDTPITREISRASGTACQEPGAETNRDQQRLTTVKRGMISNRQLPSFNSFLSTGNSFWLHIPFEKTSAKFRLPEEAGMWCHLCQLPGSTHPLSRRSTYETAAESYFSIIIKN